MNVFEDLNDQQTKAVKATDGPVLILAGAGSGKTKTLTHRIAYLLSRGVKPEHILTVTFTNKAAEEMKNRVERLLNRSIPHNFLNGGGFIGTFHSFGVRVLRQEIDRIGYNNNFVIYDDDDAFGLAKDIITMLGLPKEKFKPGSLLNVISKAKSELKELDEFLFGSSEFYRTSALRFYDQYKKRLKAANALDFDDLISLVVKILEEFPDILKKYQNQYRYILVDEYQDTNHAQYCLINLLAKKNKNLFAIGDPDQAIYGWRHADFRNILNFEKDYPDALVIKLEQNYRSTQNILNAAHQIISKNTERKDKTLWTENPSGPPVEVVEATDEREEAGFIIGKITEFKKDFGLDLDKIVVMYRTNAQSRVLEEACLYANLPYRVYGGIKFYQRKEIKDVLSYLRLIQNTNDEASFKRITDVMGKRGFAEFQKEFEGLKTVAPKLVPSELTKLAIKKSKYYDYLHKKFPGVNNEGELEAESRIQNVKELISLASKYDREDPTESLRSFLSEVALMQEERDNSRSKKLNLMTLHSAKGLEFDAVFIAGLEEGLMPHSRSAFSLDELEEERRLCYVGLTRAKQYLWLLFTKQRTLWGERNETMPSRFIMELPENLVNFRSLADGYNLPEIKLE